MNRNQRFCGQEISADRNAKKDAAFVKTAALSPIGLEVLNLGSRTRARLQSVSSHNSNCFNWILVEASSRVVSINCYSAYMSYTE